MSIFLPPRPAPAKAMTGPGALGMTWQQPIASLDKTPQKLAAQAQLLYHEHPDVNDAERTVSGRASQIAWHLETPDDVEIDDTSDPKYLAVRDLLEKPQSALPVEQRQTQAVSRRLLWRITLRHMGLCGWTYWYLDQTDALAGIPLAILYLNPARVFAVINKAGNLIGYTLDKPMEEGGTPLELANVLPFYLEPADNGPHGIGLVESIWGKAQIGQLSDRHIGSTLQAGGRLTGVISPKDAASAGTVNDEQWAGFVRDYRNIVENPNAAQRLQIVKGPIDYTRMAATMRELMIPDISKIGREAVLAHWGVPPSQIGISSPTGLNSGSTKGFDEAVLYQGAVHDRLLSFYETLQYGLLDRFKANGIALDLELEEPSYDDDTPLYQRATQAANLPLTNNERRDIIGFAPLEDDLEEFGEQIWLPALLTQVAGPGLVEAMPPVLGQPPLVPGATAPVPAPVAGPPQTVSEQAPGAEIGKAQLRPHALSALRKQIDHAYVGKFKNAVSNVLASQKADVIARLQKVGLDHLRRRKTDTASWWTPKSHDKSLMDALKPHVSQIAAKVANRTEAILSPALGKATVEATFVDKVTGRVLGRGVGRVTNINATTRDAIAQAIADAIDGAETINDVIAAVESLSIFDEYRSELIARTESMFAYNASALGSYDELGVEMVEPIDGDEDQECQDRLARGAVTLDEAEADEDHPNGTLDWVPVLSEQPAKATTTRIVVEYDDLGRFASAREVIE